jgi:hypothetical protein
MTDFPEAPASNTFKIKSTNGFEHLFTMRDETVKGLVEKIDTIEKILLDKGWTPLAQSNFPKLTEPAKYCIKHSTDQMKKNKNGKWYHSRGAYPDLEYCHGWGFADEISRKDINE